MTQLLRSFRLSAFRPLAVAAVLTATASLAVAPAVAAEALSTAQKKEIEALVRDYLVNNPEVIVEAMESLQAKKEQADSDRKVAAIQEYRSALVASAEDPVLGNPKGDVTLVEFFDYQCGYCKRVYSPMMDAVKADGKTRLVMKELPILGPASVLAARHSLAAKMQGKYEAFHDAMMTQQGPVTEESIMAAAKAAGLDTKKLAADAKKPEIEHQLKANMELAGALGLRGTPAFVIGNRFIPGAVGADVLKQAITEARKG